MSGEGFLAVFGFYEVVLHQTESHAKAKYACNSHGFDYGSTAGIANNVCQKLGQNTCAVCGLGGDKADAITLCLSDKKKKSYSELIIGDPPASLTMSAKSSAKTRAPLADSGATKLMRSVNAENVSLVRVDVIFRHT